MVPTWPAEFGGRGMTPADAGVVSRALAGFEAPDLYPYLVGLHVVAPTLLAIASDGAEAPLAAADRLRRRDLVPAVQRAGRGLRPRERRDARGARRRRVARHRPEGVDEPRSLRRVGGSSSRAPTRTSPKHAGITTFAVDMGAPGVEVRPLRQMNGDAHFSEVFLDGVVVPDTDRIGDVGAGWNVTRTALANERGALGVSGAGTGVPLDRLARHTSASGPRRLARCDERRRLAARPRDPRVRRRSRPPGSRPAAPATRRAPGGRPAPKARVPSCGGARP